MLKIKAEKHTLVKSNIMKIKLFLIIGLLITTVYGLKAQTFNSAYINYGGVLDLNTTSLLFGEASSLQEFEQYLNEPDIRASNLDLNNDGYIDYLKVTGAYENSRYIIQIYSLIGMNQYKEIASIVVRNINYRNPSIIIEGDPTIYGNNYILTPNYSRRPDILWSFSSLAFNRWNSPYYWGYYPRNYRYHKVIGLGDYYKHLNIRFGFKYPIQYYDNRSWSRRHYDNKYHNQHNNQYNSHNNNKYNSPNYNSNYNNQRYSPSNYNNKRNNKNDRTAPSNIRYRSPSVTTPSKSSQLQNNSSRNSINRSGYSHPQTTGTSVRGTQNTSRNTTRNQSVSTHPQATGTSTRAIKNNSKSTKSTNTTKNTKSNKTTSPVRR